MLVAMSVAPMLLAQPGAIDILEEDLPRGEKRLTVWN